MAEKNERIKRREGNVIETAKYVNKFKELN